MRILTVISNFNEEKAIGDTITDLRINSTIKSDILVIDNSSSDNSLEIVKDLNVDYLCHPVNSGGSSGVIKTALTYAYYHDYDIYCHIDGDNQHNAKELSNLIAPILEGEKIDIVVGSRFLEKKGFQSYFFRRLGIHIFSKLLSLITKKKITDFTSGFRAYNKNAIRFFSMKFKHEFETISQLELLMHFSGLNKIEVPVLMNPRESGKSEINLKNAIKFPLYNLLSIIGTLLNRIK